MSIQSILVLIIVCLCIVYAGKKIYAQITGKGKSPCDGCAGCNLKNQIKTCNDKYKHR